MKVYVFVDDAISVSPGPFDEWCAFADNEAEAVAGVYARYGLSGRVLRLVKTIEDRRNNTLDRRGSR